MLTPLTPDTDALPFLVVHGGWFWIILVVAFALTVGAIVAITRHVIEILRARSAVARQRAAAVSTLAEGNVVVAGRWHRGSITFGEERVELGAEARIALGSRGERIDDEAEVFASGQLKRVANARPEAAGYRDDAGTWRIEGADVYAAKPRARARPLPRAAQVIGLGFACLAGYVTLRLLGEKLVDRVEERDYSRGDGQPLYIGQLDAISIAASLPGSRDKALQELANALERHPYRDDQSVRRQLGLDRLIHGACGYLPLLRARPEEQLAMARRCHYDRAVFDILVELGRYEEAWNSRPANLDAPDTEGMVAIAIGNWSAAAVQAEKMADWAHAEASRGGGARDALIVRALRYRCLAQWFRTLAGERSGAERLRAMAVTPGNPPIVCAPIVAQTLPVQERAAYLRDTLASPVPQDAYHLMSARLLTELLLWLAGDAPRGRFTLVYDSEIQQALANGHFAVRTWLAQFGVEPWRANDAQQYVLALGGVVLRDVHRGDFDAARRAVDEAHRAAQALDPYRRDVVRYWSTLVALREGKRELPPAGELEAYMDALKVRRGEAPERIMPGYPESCAPLMRSAISAAQRGDGRPLARAMQSCSIFANFGLPTLMGVLPLVEHGRGELAAVLRWWADDFGGSSYAPFTSVVYAAARRDIARFVGDDESAETWGAMANRFMVPLQDPTRTLALVLWND
jgi:hypothetical protein